MPTRQRGQSSICGCSQSDGPAGARRLEGRGIGCLGGRRRRPESRACGGAGGRGRETARRQERGRSCPGRRGGSNSPRLLWPPGLRWRRLPVGAAWPGPRSPLSAPMRWQASAPPSTSAAWLAALALLTPWRPLESTVLTRASAANHAADVDGGAEARLIGADSGERGPGHAARPAVAASASPAATAVAVVAASPAGQLRPRSWRRAVSAEAHPAPPPHSCRAATPSAGRRTATLPSGHRSGFQPQMLDWPRWRSPHGRPRRRAQQF